MGTGVSRFTAHGGVAWVGAGPWETSPGMLMDLCRGLLWTPLQMQGWAQGGGPSCYPSLCCIKLISLALS